MHKGAIAIAVSVAVLAACGKKEKEGEPAAKGNSEPAGDPGKATAPLPQKPIGLESPHAWNYAYGKGANRFKGAQEAAKKKDWAAVHAACLATIQSDPSHLEAHRMIASALANLGKNDEAAEHLGLVLAADWLAYGPKLEGDPDLAAFLGTPAGQKVKTLSAGYKDELLRRVKGGQLVVGRRSAFKFPTGTGEQASSTRGELFAWDAETNRFIRLSQTGWTLAGFLRSPSGDEIAYVAYSKVKMPTPEETTREVPPLLVSPRIGLIPIATPETPMKEAKLKGNWRGVALDWGAGDRLDVTSWDAQGRWGVGKLAGWSIDKSTGEAKKSQATGKNTISVTYEELTPTRAGDNPLAGMTIPPLGPEEMPDELSAALSPSGEKVVFATKVDPCADGEGARQASLYLFDKAAAKLKHLARGEGVGRSRWIDDTKFLYEDDKEGIRVYDAAAGREVSRLGAKGGLSLVGLAAVSTPVCKRAAVEWEGVEETEGKDGETVEEPVE